MYLAKVYVTYKESVLDPQGQAVLDATTRLGYTGIEDIRIGKYFEITLDDDLESPEELIDSVADKLLANPNMETYRYEITKATDE